MEKAEILEMTVAYISQLHAARCRDVITGARSPRRSKSRVKREDDAPAEFDSRSSSEYRAGFIECVSHVHSFLADQPAAAINTAEINNSELTLSQLLLNHLSQFVCVGQSDLEHRVVRSTPPSPDTTLGGGTLVASSDPAALFLPLTSTSPSVKVRRQSLSGCGAQLSRPTSQTVGHRQSLLSDGAFRRDQQTGVVVREQPTSSEYEVQRGRRGGSVFIGPATVAQPLPLSSSSMSVSNSQSLPCSSPLRDNATCILPAASPSNATSDVWRPWRPETTTC